MHSTQALLVHSEGDGPWIPINRLEKIRLVNASGKDVIRLHRLEEDGRECEPFDFRGPGDHDVKLTKGKVRVTREKGSNEITVIAFCKRYRNVIEADE